MTSGGACVMLQGVVRGGRKEKEMLQICEKLKYVTHGDGLVAVVCGDINCVSDS